MDNEVATPKVASEGKLKRRQRLIESTITAIARYGLNHVTLDKVAKLAGLVAGTVNFHFKGKEELLLESARYLAESFLANLRLAMARVDDDPAQALQHIADIHIDAELSSHDKIVAWYAFWVEVSESDEYRNICNAVDQEYLSAYRRICENLFTKANKPIHQVQIDALARAIAGVLNQAWEGMVSDDGNEKRIQLKLICQAFFASIFPWAFALPVPEQSATFQGSNLRQPLAPWVFSSAAIIKKELCLFKNTWHRIATNNFPMKVGDFFTVTLTGESLLIWQGAEKCRAFYNVCQHHPHPIATAQGHAQAIICQPYGWQYDEAGHLYQWPQNLTLTLAEQAALNLVEVAVKVIHDTLWICLHAANQTSEDFPDELTQKIANITNKNNMQTKQQSINANWKTIIDSWLSAQHLLENKAIKVASNINYEVANTIKQTMVINGEEIERWLVMPGKIITWASDGYYSIEFLPLDELHTQITVDVYGLSEKLVVTLEQEMQDAINLALATQLSLRSMAATGFVGHTEEARRYWQAWMQEKLPVLQQTILP